MTLTEQRLQKIAELQKVLLSLDSDMEECLKETLNPSCYLAYSQINKDFMNKKQALKKEIDALKKDVTKVVLIHKHTFSSDSLSAVYGVRRKIKDLNKVERILLDVGKSDLIQRTPYISFRFKK